MQEAGSRRLSLVDVRQNLVVLNLRDLRTLPGLAAERVADLCVFLGDFDESLEEILVDSLVDVDSGCRSADLEGSSK